MVQSTLRRLHVPSEVEEDLAQTIFVILAKKADSLAKVECLGAWLHRATVNEAKRNRRDLARTLQKHERAIEMKQLEAEGRDPLSKALPHLDHALNALPAKDRLLIFLRYQERKTFAQVAEQLGRSEAALRKQSSRAISRLATLLQRQGVSVSSVVLCGGLGLLLAKPAHAEGLVNSIASAAASQTPIALNAPASLTSTLTMITTKMNVTLMGGGILLALSAVGGLQLGKMRAAAFTPAPQMASRSSATLEGSDAAVSAEDIPGPDDSNPTRFEKLMAELFSLAKKGRDDPATLEDVAALLAQIHERNLEEAIGFLDHLSDARQRMHLGKWLFKRWGALDPENAMSRIEDHGVGAVEKTLYARFVSRSWAESDPGAALAWHQRQENQSERLLTQKDMRNLLGLVFKHWSASDRDAAISAFSGLSYDNQKAAAIGFASSGEDHLAILREFGSEK